MKKIFQVFEGYIDRIIAAIGAIALVQFPQFYAQYLQRLGGHLDEARRIIAEYTKAAALNSLSLKEYIQIHLNSNNQVFISTGRIINNSLLRLQNLENAYKALKDSPPWARLWTFMRQADGSIAGQAWKDFTPGIPTTLESLIYALIGILLAWGTYHGIKSLIMLIYRRLTTPKKHLITGSPDLPA